MVPVLLLLQDPFRARNGRIHPRHVIAPPQKQGHLPDPQAHFDHPLHHQSVRLFLLWRRPILDSKWHPLQRRALHLMAHRVFHPKQHLPTAPRRAIRIRLLLGRHHHAHRRLRRHHRQKPPRSLRRHPHHALRLRHLRHPHQRLPGHLRRHQPA